MSKTLYMCDWKKNKECKRRNCFWNVNAIWPACKMTTNPEYAARDEKGQPIVGKERLDDEQVGDDQY